MRSEAQVLNTIVEGIAVDMIDDHAFGDVAIVPNPNEAVDGDILIINAGVVVATIPSSGTGITPAPLASLPVVEITVPVLE